MGLSNNTGGNNTIVNIIEGTFRIRSHAEDTEAISRVNKKGDTVYERRYTSLSGRIKDIYTEDTDYGKKVVFVIKDDKEYKLGLGYADGITSNIYKMLPNVNPNEIVNITLQRKPDDKGVERTSIFLSQNGNNIKWAYTRDNRNGMPELEKIIVKGEEIWDNTKQVEWLWSNAVLPFIERKDELKNETNTVEVGGLTNGDISVDDIPF